MFAPLLDSVTLLSDINAWLLSPAKKSPYQPEFKQLKERLDAMAIIYHDQLNISPWADTQRVSSEQIVALMKSFRALVTFHMTWLEEADKVKAGDTCGN